jgi:pilus assembly protein Flp/PilA
MLTELYIKAMSSLNQLKSRKGQTLVEYALILALVSIVVIVILTLLGSQIQTIFSQITSTLAGS